MSEVCTIFDPKIIKAAGISDIIFYHFTAMFIKLFFPKCSSEIQIIIKNTLKSSTPPTPTTTTFQALLKLIQSADHVINSCRQFIAFLPSTTQWSEIFVIVERIAWWPLIVTRGFSVKNSLDPTRRLKRT